MEKMAGGVTSAANDGNIARGNGKAKRVDKKRERHCST